MNINSTQTPINKHITPPDSANNEHESTTSYKRIQWVDIAKSIGLLLMILGHGKLLNLDAKQFIYSFHMPLFFILAGVFYKPISIKETINKDFKRLLIPFVLINIAMICYLGLHKIVFGHGLFSLTEFRILIISSFIGLSKNVNGLTPACTPSWFLISLFYIHCIASIGYKKPMAWLILSSLICASISLIIYTNSIETYTPIDSSLMAFPFFAIGYLLKRQLMTIKVWQATLAVFVLIALHLVLNYYNGRVDVAQLEFGNSPMVFYLCATFGSLAVICVSLIIESIVSKRLSACLSEFATGAVLIIGFNLAVISYFDKFNSAFLEETYLIVGIIEGLLIQFLFYPLISFTRRYFPIILGR